ncbi:MAG TPA: DivIVA domain-containing protein [Pseudonocardiaceae bacterium]
MPLTPADVHNVAFRKPPIGKRGYYEDEVDTFLDLVADELARLIEENTDLRHQIEQLEHPQRAASPDAGPAPGPQPPPPMTAMVPPPMEQQATPGGDHQAHAAKVMRGAQEMADRLTSQAHAEADKTLGRARARAEQLLSQAQAKADELINQARIQAEAMLTDARTSAETTERQAQDRTASLERAAVRQHTEAIAALNQEKNALEKKIDQLRGFEREYRTRLQIYLTSRVRQLGEWESADPLDPIHTQPDLVTSTSRFGPQSTPHR